VAESSGRRKHKKVKYVAEDDDGLSETEQVIAADKKKRARQLDYQLRTVRSRRRAIC
jgi:hypothetical protein